MKKNMGTTDRTLRIIAAVVITVLFFAEILTGTLGIILLAFAFILFLTSLTGNCPLYPILGMNTCCKKKDKE